MSSKDKLIEFLKSANIEYIESPIYEYSKWVKTNRITYHFHVDGNYSCSSH